MTPAQLAVEADALLMGGRTPEEVREMQAAPALRLAAGDALRLLAYADFSNGITAEYGSIDEGEVLACRMIDRIRMLLHSISSGAKPSSS